MAMGDRGSKRKSTRREQRERQKRGGQRIHGRNGRVLYEREDKVRVKGGVRRAEKSHRD